MDGGGGDTGGGDATTTIIIVVVVTLVTCAIVGAVVTARNQKNQTDKVLGSLAASRRETLAAQTQPSRSAASRSGGRQTVHNAAFDAAAAKT